jgi:glycosyltransferase involved in cell wall biosynthesis
LRVTVLIPSYDGARYLRDAIETAQTQTRPPAEVIVVDDGSRDDSVAIAKSCAGVRVIEQPNQGVAMARNAGLRVATGDFVVFLDSDDRLLPHAIETGLAAFAAHPECGFVYGTSRVIDAGGAELPRPPRAPVPDASYRTFLEGKAMVPPSCGMFRRAAVDAVGGFRQERVPTEDYDFYLRVARRHPIHCHDRLVTEYRRHAGNASGNIPTRMIRSAHATLEEQRREIAGDAALEAAIERGRSHWAGVFAPGLPYELRGHLRRGRLGPALDTLGLLLRHDPRALARVVTG